MSRSLILLIVGLLVVVGIAVALGSMDTKIAPKTVEKDMLNEAAAQ
ncbi:MULTISPECIES: hypothetical protein [Sphingomonas]|uniref:Capsular polysaccharide biosynthesis protein n=2 Tax=Sphingomonas TaxID=13687 RepID=A0A7W9F1I3_9SPHN|nr:hypothetical protein [Sphingomonas prati]MBB5729512.1 capsular polysaccharide biosynthesis protein [Sphingomonas prati]